MITYQRISYDHRPQFCSPGSRSTIESLRKSLAGRGEQTRPGSYRSWLKA
jgi:hypothetical protein